MVYDFFLNKEPRFGRVDYLLLKSYSWLWAVLGHLIQGLQKSHYNTTFKRHKPRNMGTQRKKSSLLMKEKRVAEIS